MKNFRKVTAMFLPLTLALTLVIPGQQAEAKKKAVKKKVVRLNKTKATLYTGKKLQLKLKNLKKGKKVKWSSNRKKVATVSKKGLVKAKRTGTAKITAKVGNKKYNCTIRVKKKAKKAVKPATQKMIEPTAETTTKPEPITTTPAPTPMQTVTKSVAKGNSVVTQIELSARTTDDLKKTTTIKSIMNHDTLCSGVVGLVGEPFSVTTDAKMENASISFKINTTKLQNTTFGQLMILWYDEENDNFVALDTGRDEAAGTVSVNITHTGKYMLVDQQVWTQNWKKISDSYASFSENGQLTSDKMTDTDKDGLPDEIEKTGIPMSNGQLVVTDPEKADTDGDGLSDGEEAGAISDVKGVPFAQGYRFWFRMKSNPTLPDTDYDGIKDKEDSDKMHPDFSGVLDTNYTDARYADISYSFCLKDFFGDNQSYNPDLSTFSTVMSAIIYGNANLKLKNNAEDTGRTAAQMLAFHGFKDVKDYKIAEGAEEFSISKYEDNHLSEICMGHQKVTYNGETKDIVAVIVRGTNGTIEEWSSNFDIGSTKELDAFHKWKTTGDTLDFDDTLNYFAGHDEFRQELEAFSDWKNADNHKGFDIVTNRILTYVHAYVNRYVEKENAVYWVSGHSRGAAVANLLSADLVDENNRVFGYTFAAPNTTISENATADKYGCIFNIVNSDDLVPAIPMDSWNFRKYGKTFRSSISGLQENEWKALASVDYRFDANLNATLEQLSAVTSDREHCYEDTSYVAADYADEAALKNAIPANALPYYQYNSGEKKANEPPICFLQYIAGAMVNDQKAYSALIRETTSPKYGNATNALISAVMRGITHPHYIYSYYLLAKEVDE